MDRTASLANGRPNHRTTGSSAASGMPGPGQPLKTVNRHINPGQQIGDIRPHQRRALSGIVRNTIAIFYSTFSRTYRSYDLSYSRDAPTSTILRKSRTKKNAKASGSSIDYKHEAA
jgi:hypothetical protein